MLRTFVEVADFTAKWQKIGLTDQDLRALQNMLMRAPAAGPVISGTGGLRKARFAPPSWRGGKSGGLRVCYVDAIEAETIVLVMFFAKSEQDNLTPADKQLIRPLVEAIKREARRE